MCKNDSSSLPVLPVSPGAAQAHGCCGGHVARPNPDGGQLVRLITRRPGGDACQGDCLKNEDSSESDR